MFRGEAVEIPTTILFEEMLKQMHLPKPNYKGRVLPEGFVQASVIFFPVYSSTSLCTSIQLSGNPMSNVNDANNDAAKQAIIYMERTHGKILKDYSYEELQKKNEVKDQHMDELSALHRKYRKIIQEKDEQIMYLTESWDDCLTAVSNMNNKIDMLAQASYTLAETPLEKDINSILHNIQLGTMDLNRLTFQYTELLKKVGKYPCPEEDFAYDVDSLCSMDFLHL